MERCINQNICIMAGITKLSFRAAGKQITITYTFTVPANSTDKNINIAFTDNNNNHATFGVSIDDIEIRPSTELAIFGASDVVLNSTYNYSVSSGTASGISYNWNMGASATPATSTSATPSTK